MGAAFEEKTQEVQDYNEFARRAAAPEGRELFMSEEIRTEMEGFFGYDFSGVTLREKPEVEELGDRAYAVGNEIHFAPGQFQPENEEGKRLLVHELTHVVQHAEGRAAVPGGFATGETGVQEEEAAETARSYPAHAAVPGPKLSLEGGLKEGEALKSLGNGEGQTLLAATWMEKWIKMPYLRAVSALSRSFRKRDTRMETKETYKEAKKTYEKTIKKTEASAAPGKAHSYGSYQRGTAGYVPGINMDKYMKDPVKEEIRTDTGLAAILEALQESPGGEQAKIFREAAEAIHMYTDIPNAVSPESVRLEISALNQIRRKAQEYHTAHVKLKEQTEKKRASEEELRELEASENRDRYLRGLWVKLETGLSGKLDLVTQVEAETESSEAAGEPGGEPGAEIPAYVRKGMEPEMGEDMASLAEPAEEDPDDALFRSLYAWSLALSQEKRITPEQGKAFTEALEQYIKSDPPAAGEKIIQRKNFCIRLLVRIENSPSMAKAALDKTVKNGKTYISTDASDLSGTESNMAATPLFLHTPCLNDIRQNSFRDCFLMSAVQALIQTNPEYIYSMFTDLGNGDVVVRMYRSIRDNSYGLHYVPNFIKIRKQFDVGNVYNGGAPWVQTLEKAYAINEAFSDSLFDEVDESGRPKEELLRGRWGEEKGTVEFHGTQEVFMNGGDGTVAIAFLTGKQVGDNNRMGMVKNAPLLKRRDEMLALWKAWDTPEGRDYTTAHGEDPQDDLFLEIHGEFAKWKTDLSREKDIGNLIRSKEIFVRKIEGKAADYVRETRAHITDTGSDTNTINKRIKAQSYRLVMLDELMKGLNGLRITPPADALAEKKASGAYRDIKRTIRSTLDAGGAVMFGQGCHFYTLLDMKEEGGQTFYLIRDPFNVENYSYEKKEGEEEKESSTGYGSVMVNWLIKRRPGLLESWKKMADQHLQGMSWWSEDTILNNENGETLIPVYPETAAVLKEEKPGDGSGDQEESPERMEERRREKERKLAEATTAKEAMKARDFMDYEEKGLSLKERIERIRYDDRLDQNARIRQAGAVIIKEIQKVLKENPSMNKTLVEQYKWAHKEYAIYANEMKKEEEELDQVLAVHPDVVNLQVQIADFEKEKKRKKSGNKKAELDWEVLLQIKEYVFGLIYQDEKFLEWAGGRELVQKVRNLLALRKEAGKLKEKYVEASRQLRNAQKESNQKNAELIRKVLSQIRELGAGKDRDMTTHLTKSSETKGMDEVVKKAYANYPKEWVEASMDFGSMEVKKADRGSYNNQDRVIKLSGKDPDAAYRTAVHELGHRMEYVLPEILEQERQFFQRRKGVESPMWLGEPFEEREKAIFSDFLDPYMGKAYHNFNCFELVSMGFELAFTEPEKLLQDEDMAQWIFGMLGIL